MQIQLNSDSNVAVDVGLSAFVEGSVLARFADQIGRVEVHLSDVNGERIVNQNERCPMEGRATSRDSVVVIEEAATVEMAVRGAIHQMDRLLSSRLGCLEART